MSLSQVVKRESVDMNRLTNNRAITLISNSIQVASGMGVATDHPAIKCMQPIQEDLSVLRGILGREVVLSERKELDEERDEDFVYIKTMLQAYVISRDTSKKEAANSLLTVFNTFDINLEDMAMDVQTEKLQKVIAIWEKSEHKANFETLGLSADFDKLKTSSTAFIEYDIARSQEKKEQAPKARDVRKKLQKNYLMWLDVLEGIANLNNDKFCYQCLSSINTYIKEQKAYLKSKATRSEGSDSDD
ncbi:MAG: DUF6261 family protein [Bacteroidales bacterium]|nr:DUF6261 family protein [Bacteroidales bacterium]